MEDPKRLEPSTFRLVNTTSTISESSQGAKVLPQYQNESKEGKGGGSDEELRDAKEPEPRDAGLEHSDDRGEQEHAREEDPPIDQRDPDARGHGQAHDQRPEHP